MLAAASDDRFAGNLVWSNRLWRLWQRMKQNHKTMPILPPAFDRYCKEQAAEWDEYVRTTPELPLPP
jgi:hypothetical protein